mmetsp:Transcript_36702/g.57351  ORF Transcript_36702/g.57351 Transcript_36702/m.57351 type:complete len:226 (-) Transcript_36702:448-1125(-)
MQMDRDEEAYGMIKLTVADARDNQAKIRESREHGEGYWPFPRQADIYEDFFACMETAVSPGTSLTGLDAKRTNIRHLTALLIIKMRIVSSYSQKILHLHEFWRVYADLLAREDSCLPSISEDLINSIGKHLRSAKDSQVLVQQRLMNAILEKNGTLLKAVVNPEPLIRQGQPEVRSSGSAEEAFCVLVETEQLFDRIPGAKESIRDFLGENTTYYPSFHSITGTP